MAEESGVTMAKPIDVRLNLDDELANLLDAEVKRLRTSGRAGYFTQMLAAVQLARKGDLSLIGMLVPQGATAPVPTQVQPAHSASTDLIEAEDVQAMF